MKRKILVGISIMVFIATLGGLFFILKNRRPVVPQTVKKTPVKTELEQMMNKISGLFCSYTDKKGQLVEAYLKKDKIRLNGSKLFNGSGSLIMKEGKLWIWSNASKEGFIFNTALLDNTGLLGGETGAFGEVIKDVDNYRKTCVPKAVEDSNYTVPPDANFKDLSPMIGGLK